MPKKKPKPGSAPDRLTMRWVKNASDERAVANGCRFDEARGVYVVDWTAKYCRLYEGEWAGEPLVLRDWQLDCTMRLFGWTRWSDRWGKMIRRFREASVWVAKKNKKTPTLAAWALYLLAGDGEPGQKVFLAAKDGRQVRENLAKHVHEMLMQSDDLGGECDPNKSTMQITHAPSRSALTILSSSNKRTQESKEGLNGSVLVDETHVVDREFMSRVTRAGISRSEPLRIEVSTAGNNPDGYGKERFDRAVKVERGEIEDQELFACVHAAPQDLADADLAADPLKYGRMANPAMGHTVDPEEYLTDYGKSCDNIGRLAEFKMYRLNIWQHSTNPWLRESDWAACREDFTLDDLEGQQCWAGLDLSKTQDMTALVLIFRGDAEGEYRIVPFFWLPEAVAVGKAALAPFLQWKAAGYLETTPGNVVDYGYIKSRFRKLAARFDIQILSYDIKYAEDVTQSLEQGQTTADGVQIEEGTGVHREAFPQNMSALCGPTAEFERLVISHKLRHDGNPVLAWQAGHVNVFTDANNNKRPVKPKGEDHRKIDGIVAGIMALAKATEASDQTPGVFTLP